MKHNKKNVTKMKFVRVNQPTKDPTNEETEIFDSEIKEKKTNDTDLSENNDAQTMLNQEKTDESLSKVPKTNYKHFVNNTEEEEIVVEKTTFRLPKFLAQREETKNRLEKLKKSGTENQQSAGSLPFIQPNFSDNPNSFTSIFNKDNEKINGVQRVFRKSITFLILQLVVFACLSLATIFTFSLNLNTFTLLGISSLTLLLIMVLYVSISSIFYIIVADRSYIWISVLLQSLLVILLYSFMGQGFGYPTLVVSVIVAILNYFAYLEIEKVQVSTRFFSIGYVTTEAVKVLSTIAILIVCLGVFNSVYTQTPKVFLTRHLIENDIIFKNVVANNSRISLNSLFQIRSDYKLNQSNNTLLSSENKEVSVSDFMEKNYSEKYLSSSVRDSCNESDKECQTNASEDKPKRLENDLNKLIEIGKISPQIKLNDKLTYNNYKSLLKGFYSEKINDFETTKNTQTIPVLSSVQWLVEPSRTILIPALFSLLFYIILLTIKFLIHFVVSIFIWIFWKILLMTGFVKIEVELVESEIVSI
jgi:hypothetical protein